MRLEAKLGGLAGALDHAREPGRGEQRAALRREHEWRRGVLLALQATRCAQWASEILPLAREAYSRVSIGEAVSEGDVSTGLRCKWPVVIDRGIRVGPTSKR